jgi:hypothetical protein
MLFEEPEDFWLHESSEKLDSFMPCAFRPSEEEFYSSIIMS